MDRKKALVVISCNPVARTIKLCASVLLLVTDTKCTAEYIRGAEQGVRRQASALPSPLPKPQTPK
eukprot:1497777-Amphidinium_carterae.1